MEYYVIGDDKCFCEALSKEEIEKKMIDESKRVNDELAKKEPSFTKNNAFNKNFGSTADTVCRGNDARLSDARTPTSHSHADYKLKGDFAIVTGSGTLSGGGCGINMSYPTGFTRDNCVPISSMYNNQAFREISTYLMPTAVRFVVSGTGDVDGTVINCHVVLMKV